MTCPQGHSIRIEVTTSSCFCTMTLGGVLQASDEWTAAFALEGAVARTGAFTTIAAEALTSWTRVDAAMERDDVGLPNSGAKAEGMGFFE